MSIDKQQHLIDIVFEIAQISAEYMHGKTQKEICTWVAEQLKICGFPTIPIGMSWGYLTKEYRKNNE